VKCRGNKQKNLIKQQKHDTLKTHFCEKNNYKLLWVPYWEFGNVSQIVSKFIIDNSDWGSE